MNTAREDQTEAGTPATHRTGEAPPKPSEHGQAAVRLGPFCKTKLPADANPRRIH